MKKIFACLAAMLVLTLGLAGCVNESYVDNLDTGDNGDLSVLVLSDIMFDGSSLDDVKTQAINAIVNHRDKEDNNDKNKKPYELIVVNGNIVNGNDNGGLMKKAVALFDSFEIPWAITLGDKDIQGKANRDKIVKIIKKSKYCVLNSASVMKYDDTNYAINVNTTTNPKLVSTLYFLDSTQPVTQGLVDWYTTMVNNNNNGIVNNAKDNVSSVVFSNKPISKFADKYEEHKQDNYEYKQPVTVWEGSELLEKAIVNANGDPRSKLYVAGCDTLNYFNFYSNSSNIQWVYSRSMNILTKPVAPVKPENATEEQTAEYNKLKEQYDQKLGAFNKQFDSNGYLRFDIRSNGKAGDGYITNLSNVSIREYLSNTFEQYQ